MKQKLHSLVLFIFIAMHGYGQCNFNNTAFSVGEKVQYNVFYKLGFMWFNAAYAEFNVADTAINNVPAFVFKSYGSTLPNYDWLYKVRDNFQSVAEKESLNPLSFSRVTSEGNYKVNNNYAFNYNHNIIYSSIENSKTPQYSDTLDISSCILDVLTAIYACRTFNVSNINLNDTISLNMLIDNKVHNLYLRYIGQEYVELEDEKKFNCNKFTILLIEGTIFSGGENLTVWISDDKAKIPLKVKAEILVGSVVAIINKVSGNQWFSYQTQN